MKKKKKVFPNMDLFFPYKINRWEAAKKPEDIVSSMVSEDDGRLVTICYRDKISPILDHYNSDINRQLGKKLFKL